MDTLRNWVREWQFWAAVGTMIVSIGSYVLMTNQGIVRFGTIAPRQVDIGEFCSFNSSSADRILTSIQSVVAQVDCDGLDTVICNELGSYPYGDISVGACFVCPDSATRVASLTMIVRTNSSNILKSIVVGTSTNKTKAVIGQDSNSVTLELTNLAPGESSALLIVNEGKTEEPYDIIWPKSESSYHLRHVSEDYPWEFHTTRYVFFGSLGIVLGLVLCLLGSRPRSTPYRLKIEFTSEQLREMLEPQNQIETNHDRQ